MDTTIFVSQTNFLSNADFQPPVFNLTTKGHTFSATFYATVNRNFLSLNLSVNVAPTEVLDP